MQKDIEEQGQSEYEAWLAEFGGVDPSSPTEENLVALVSRTLRAVGAEDRAAGLVDVANMCLALADKTLGCQVPVAKCLIAQIH